MTDNVLHWPTMTADERDTAVLKAAGYGPDDNGYPSSHRGEAIEILGEYARCECIPTTLLIDTIAETANGDVVTRCLWTAMVGDASASARSGPCEAICIAILRHAGYTVEVE